MHDDIELRYLNSSNISDGTKVTATLHFTGQSGNVLAEQDVIRITGGHVLKRCTMCHLFWPVRAKETSMRLAEMALCR